MVFDKMQTTLSFSSGGKILKFEFRFNFLRPVNIICFVFMASLPIALMMWVNLDVSNRNSVEIAKVSLLFFSHMFAFIMPIIVIVIRIIKHKRFSNNQQNDQLLYLQYSKKQVTAVKVFVELTLFLVPVAINLVAAAQILTVRGGVLPDKFAERAILYFFTAATVYFLAIIQMLWPSKQNAGNQDEISNIKFALLKGFIGLFVFCAFGLSWTLIRELQVSTTGIDGLVTTSNKASDFFVNNAEIICVIPLLNAFLLAFVFNSTVSAGLFIPLIIECLGAALLIGNHFVSVYKEFLTA